MKVARSAVRTAIWFVLVLMLASWSGPALAMPRAHSAIAIRVHPWVEGVDPGLENSLFEATYQALPAHNVLKVYAFSAGGYESAGIRFSARVPHEARDLTALEIAREAATLIRTAFDDFPSVEEVDIWGTVPVSLHRLKSVENTVFSMSANREVYVQLEERPATSDETFVGAFGRVWFASQVRR